MKIAVIQTFPEWGRIEENVDHVSQVILNMEADLVVLPELFNSGYHFISRDEVIRYAEKIPEGFTTQSLIRVAKKKDFFIVAGLAEREGKKVFNSAILVGPSGFHALYRKSHLFYEEKLVFDPGDTGFTVQDIGIAKIGIIVCFDWIYPEATRILALQGAQVICQPANLVFTLCHKTMIARAIENRVYMVTANRVGWEKRDQREKLVFSGLSQMVDPEGNRLFQLSGDREEHHVTDVDPHNATNKMFTQYNHLMKDRRVDLYRDLLLHQTNLQEQGG